VLTRYRARRHQMFIGQWGPDYLDPHTNAAAFAFNPDNGDDAGLRTLAWRNGWAIPDLSRTTQAAMAEPDIVARAALYRALQERVLADSPFIVMFQDSALYARRARVHGFTIGLMPDMTRYDQVTKTD